MKPQNRNLLASMKMRKNPTTGIEKTKEKEKN